MKRVLIASILGFASSIVSSYGQADYNFDTYAASSSSNVHQGKVQWSSNASLAPAGMAGLTVGAGFSADLLWASGALSGDLGLSVPVSADGYIRGLEEIFDPTYTPNTPITFTIQAWSGGSAFGVGNTANGSISFVDAGSAVGAGPTLLGAGPGPLGSSPNSFPLSPITVELTTIVPEPTTLALAGLGAAGLLMFRKRQ
jgi:hypothetical protein